MLIGLILLNLDRKLKFLTLTYIRFEKKNTKSKFPNQ